MFGFQLDDDEWLAVIGVFCLVLRVVWGITGIFWSFATQTQYSPIGQAKVSKLKLFLTSFSFGALGIALVSMLSGGFRQDPRSWIIVYMGICIAGTFVGFCLELIGHIFGIFFSRWLSAFRVSQYREQLQSGNAEERLIAANQLLSIGSYATPARPELLYAFRDESADVRATAGLALLYSTTKPPPAEDSDTPSAARAALADPDLRVRTIGAVLLVQYHAVTAEEVLPTLMEGVSQGDDQTNLVALEGLTPLGPAAAPACTALRDLVFRRHHGSVFAVFQAIGAPAVPMIIEILEKGEFGPLDFGIKLVAIDTLGKMGSPAWAALPVLRKLALQDPKLSGQVAKTIKKLGGNIT